MSRRSYKTVNVSKEVAQWIDSLVKDRGPVKAPRPLGIATRDEFVRIAIALLGASLPMKGQHAPPVEMLRELVRRLDEHESGAGDAPTEDEDDASA